MYLRKVTFISGNISGARIGVLTLETFFFLAEVLWQIQHESKVTQDQSKRN